MKIKIEIANDYGLISSTFSTIKKQDLESLGLHVADLLKKARDSKNSNTDMSLRIMSVLIHWLRYQIYAEILSY